MTQVNPFLNMGPGGIPLPAPIATSRGLSPAIYQIARDMSAQAVNFASGVAGEKGLLSGSGFANTLSNAYLGGVNQAVGIFQGQQGLYNQYAQQLMRMRSAAGPGRRRSGIDQFLGAALPIASVGLGFARLFQGGGGGGDGSSRTGADQYLASIGQAY